MNPLYGKALLLIGLIATIVIRIPHDKRNAKISVRKSQVDGLEKILLALVAVGVMLLPIIYIFTPLLSFADYEFSPTALVVGAILLVANIWLFYRAHADLGTNWSKSLELREGHKLVTGGVCKNIRHPMYTAIFLYVLAQCLLLPNWIAGFAGLVAFTLMYLFRDKREEQMMLQSFGAEYRAYVERTKRIVPFVF